MLSNIEKRDRKEVGGPPSIALFLSHDIDKKHLRISLLKWYMWLLYTVSLSTVHIIYVQTHPTWPGICKHELEMRQSQRRGWQSKLRWRIMLEYLTWWNWCIIPLLHQVDDNNLLPQHLSSMWASCSSFLGGKFVTPSFTMEVLVCDCGAGIALNMS